MTISIKLIQQEAWYCEQLQFQPLFIRPTIVLERLPKPR